MNVSNKVLRGTSINVYFCKFVQFLGGTVSHSLLLLELELLLQNS